MMEQMELQAGPDIRQLKKALRRDANRSGLILLLFFGLTILLGLGFRELMQSFVFGKIDDGIYYNLVLLGCYIIQFPVVVSLTLLINRIRSKSRVKDLFVRPKASAGYIAKWMLIGAGLTYAANYVFNFAFLIFQELSGIEMTEIAMQSDNSALGRVTIFIVMAIFAPIFEELFFRGGVLQNIRPHGELLAIILSAAAFGLFHMNYTQIFYACTMGAVAGFIFCKTKSILPVIGLHFAINLIAVTQTILLSGVNVDDLQQIVGNEEAIMALPADQLLPLILVGLLVILCVGICVAGVVLFIIELCKNRDKMKLENGCPELSAGQKFAAVATAPLMILFVVASVAMTIINAAGVG